jgi:hypothetical protein
VIKDYRRATQHNLEDSARRLGIAWSDLLFAGTTFQWLVAHPSYHQHLSGEREALIASAVVAYARPFVASKGAAWLPKRDWPGYTKPRWNELHEILIDYRNEYVGHSGLARRTVTIRRAGGDPEWRASINLPFEFRPGIAETAITMCSDLVQRLHDEFKRAIEELVRRQKANDAAGRWHRITLSP